MRTLNEMGWAKYQHQHATIQKMNTENVPERDGFDRQCKIHQNTINLWAIAFLELCTAESVH
jgi:hypothetical protein